MREESRLTRHDYWEEFYEAELELVQDEADGTQVEEKVHDWFEEQSDKIATFLEEKVKKADAHVLDVGCGSGAFLRRLRELGFSHLYGCDYAPTAVKVGLTLEEKFDKFPRIAFESLDITAESSPGGEGPVTARVGKGGGFDVFVDKGTFDIFFMQRKCAMYRAGITKFLPPVGNAAHFLVTSCNATEEELRNEFQLTGEACVFEVVDSLGHKTFTFGGVTGEVVATVWVKAERL